MRNACGHMLLQGSIAYTGQTCGGGVSCLSVTAHLNALHMLQTFQVTRAVYLLDIPAIHCVVIQARLSNVRLPLWLHYAELSTSDRNTVTDTHFYRPSVAQHHFDQAGTIATSFDTCNCQYLPISAQFLLWSKRSQDSWIPGRFSNV